LGKGEGTFLLNPTPVMNCVVGREGEGALYLGGEVGFLTFFLSSTFEMKGRGRKRNWGTMAGSKGEKGEKGISFSFALL